MFQVTTIHTMRSTLASGTAWAWVCVCVCVLLSACTTGNNRAAQISHLISPYKVEVVQGNFVSKEQKEALRTGMTRDQVRDILGSPLITSAFHADRWDYVFTIFRQGQEPQRRSLTVFFKGEELVKVDSDALLSEEEFVKSLSTGRRLGKVPVLEASADSLKAAANPTKASPVSNPIPANSAPGAALPYPPLEPSPQVRRVAP
jgi:outer membrane protein assembly factor BamE